MKKIKIGICGWGTVAIALHRSILENKNQIKRTHQVDLEIVAIGARRDNPKYLSLIHISEPTRQP